MISPKKSRNAGILVLVVASAAVLILSQWTFCGPRHVMITGAVSDLGDSFDPERCQMVLDDILTFNDDCDEQIGIIDCG